MGHGYSLLEFLRAISSSEIVICLVDSVDTLKF